MRSWAPGKKPRPPTPSRGATGGRFSTTRRWTGWSAKPPASFPNTNVDPSTYGGVIGRLYYVSVDYKY